MREHVLKFSKLFFILILTIGVIAGCSQSSKKSKAYFKEINPEVQKLNKELETLSGISVTNIPITKTKLKIAKRELKKINALKINGESVLSIVKEIKPPPDNKDFHENLLELLYESNSIFEETAINLEYFITLGESFKSWLDADNDLDTFTNDKEEEIKALEHYVEITSEVRDRIISAKPPTNLGTLHDEEVKLLAKHIDLTKAYIQSLRNENDVNFYSNTSLSSKLSDDIEKKENEIDLMVEIFIKKINADLSFIQDYHLALRKAFTVLRTKNGD